MNFQQRVSGLVQLGQFFSQVLEQKEYAVFDKAYQQNPWFTPDNIRQSIRAWSGLLTEPKLRQWLAPYTIAEHTPKTVAIIMAGNIPLVGLHDLLCVLLSGNKALVKLSEDDTVLMKWVINELARLEPGFTAMIEVSEQRLPKAFDAVIATGSNNTNRYFEYYFKNKPSLLRGNRNSVAVITGKETPEDFQKLGEDIFTYFGLGCRNVSKLYVPEGYDFVPFYEGIESFNEVIYHHKYANNYNYHKAILLLNLDQHLDNHFLLVKESTATASPLGVMFYETYTSADALQKELESKASEIQCIVSKTTFGNAFPFGKAQQPELWDYADGVDTVAFLLNNC
jgi:hypothetical protein